MGQCASRPASQTAAPKAEPAQRVKAASTHAAVVPDKSAEAREPANTSVREPVPLKQQNDDERRAASLDGVASVPVYAAQDGSNESPSALSALAPPTPLSCACALSHHWLAPSQRASALMRRPGR